jgi:hypothetical protein
MKKLCAAVCASAVVAGSTMATPVVTKFRLSDHPDGNQNPPPYGLRIDGLFGGGVTTFSINGGTGTTLTVVDDGSTITIDIDGVLYGGEASGGVYTGHTGLYEVHFSYTMNVVEDGTGWRVTNQHALNAGTIEQLSSGTTWNIADKYGNGPGYSFAFLQDDHRLAGHPEQGQGYWVGRGWVMGAGSGTRDWLFLGELIPLPSTAGLGLAGLGLVAIRRRR